MDMFAERELHEMNGIRAERAIHTDSIIISNGVIGTAETPKGQLSIIASGKILRVEINEIDGYVDVNLSDVAVRAYEILTQEKYPE